jgi:hypothetical protein
MCDSRTAAVLTRAVQSQAVENDLLDCDQGCLKIDPLIAGAPRPSEARLFSAADSSFSEPA